MTNPSMKSPYATGMTPRWDMLRAVEGGTETMREAGKTHLPQHPAEPGNAYAIRLARSTFLNTTMMAVRHVMNTAFGAAPTISEDGQELFEDVLSDIDNEGRNLFSFARPLFFNTVHMGESYVVVDMDNEGDGATAADRRRPFAKIYPADSCIDYQQGTVAGEPIVEHARFVENLLEFDRSQFKYIVKKRVRVFEPGLVEVWDSVAVDQEKLSNPSPKNKNELSFIKNEELSGDIDIDKAPIRRFRFGETDGKGLLRPMFQDLAHKNIEHWQSSSDQRNILTMARFPILYASGLQDEEKEELVKEGIGPRTLLHASDHQAKFGYVEPAGNAINAGAADLNVLKEEMAELSHKPFMPNTGNIAATTNALEKASEHSMVASSNIEFEDGINAVMELFAEWMDKDSAPTITMNPIFGLKEFDAQKVQAIQSARGSGDITRETYLRLLKEEKLLDSEFDIQDELTRLEEEVDALDVPVIQPIQQEIEDEAA